MAISSEMFDQLQQPGAEEAPTEEMDLSGLDEETLQQELERRQLANKARQSEAMAVPPQTIASGGLLVPPITRPAQKGRKPLTIPPRDIKLPSNPNGVELSDPEEDKKLKERKKMFA